MVHGENGMKRKRNMKQLIDFVMTGILLALMLLLFVIHNILNVRWYGSLFKQAAIPSGSTT